MIKRFRPKTGEPDYSIKIPSVGTIKINGVFETSDKRDIAALEANDYIEEVIEPKPKKQPSKQKAEKE